MNRASSPPSAPRQAGRRYAGIAALLLFLPLPLITGCPFKTDEYVVRCDTFKDCSDGNPCTEDKCTMGICENPPKPKETACGAASASVCDGAGHCIECLSNADCAANHPMTPVCDVKAKQCVSCADGIKNGKETDVDCGGPDCGACLGQPCDPQNNCGNGTFCSIQDNICCSTVCGDKCEACVQVKTGQPDGTCAAVPYTMDPDNECGALGGCGQAPHKCRCEDGMKNNDESDVDCGGMTCPRCGGGQMCGDPTDCASTVPACVSGACCSSLCTAPCFYCDTFGQCISAPPGYPNATCSANQACGPAGVTCAGKAGAPCNAAFGGADCLSGVCGGTPTKTCQKSAPGKPCNSDTDCSAGTCQNYICI
ncbi:MAG: hypothetical protein QM820_59800 [Minicystis sp.]